jgi:hypothetical protein
MKETLISELALDTIVELNKEIKEGMKFFIEEMLENGHWPTEEKL